MRPGALLVLSLLSLRGIVCPQITQAQEQKNAAAVEPQEGQQSKNRGRKSVSPEPIFRRTYSIHLGKGNRLRLELTDERIPDALINIDSVVQVALLDMVPLKDSFTDPLSTKRVLYTTDLSGNKTIHFRQTRPGGLDFLISDGVLSALKTEQDTVILSGAGYPYRLSFYLNRIGELADYVDGRLNEKMREIRENPGGKKWMPNLNNWYVLMPDTSVWVKKKGGAHFRVMSYLGPDLTGNIGNYKNYFVSSLSLGVAVSLNNGLVRHDIVASWEPQFLFAKSPPNNQLNTYRNDFIAISYKLSSATSHEPAGGFALTPFVSIGYLYHREGDYYDPHTFRLGIGKANLLKERITLQPELFFHDFFRGVTPGLKLAVGFL